MKKNRVMFLLHRMIGENRITTAMPLYSGKTREEACTLITSELLHRIGLAMAAGMLLLVVSFVASSNEKEENERQLTRPAVGEASRFIPVLLETEEGLLSGELELGARRYTEEEVEELHRMVQEQLEDCISGSNKDLLHVTEDLYFPEELPGLSTGLSWYSDHPELVTGRGEVKNEELSVPAEVTVTAKIFYGEEYRTFSRQITVMPKVYTDAEAAWRNGMKSLQEQEKEGRTSESFLLPETVLGMRISLPEQNSVPLPAVCAVLLAAMLPAAYYGYFNDIEKKKRKRAEEAKRAYQEFMTRLSLLMAAGLSARYTWKRLTGEYTERYGRDGHVLARELFVTESELENGRSEVLAYEAFGERMGIVSYQRLAALLTQYVTKGVQGIQQQLLNEAKEVLAQEREQIKVRGEEAGTKLLLPMMGLLVLVFAILLVPAFLSFS